MTAAGTWPQPHAHEPPDIRRRTPRYVHAFRALLYFSLFMAVAWGGPVIRAAALCALPLALWSDREGGLRHLLRIGALTLAVWLAPSAAPALGDLISSLFNVPGTIAIVGGFALLALGVITLAGFVGRRIARRLRKHPHFKGADHILGGLVGSAEGVLVVVVGCWLLVTFEGPIESLHRRLPADQGGTQSWVVDTLYEMHATVRNDDTGQWLTRTNPLEEIPVVQTAQMVAEFTTDPGQVLAAIDEGRLNAVAELPEVKRYVQAFEEDTALKQALQRGDVTAIINNPHVRSMLNDRDLHRALLAHRDEIRRAVGKPDYKRLEREARRLDPGTRRTIKDLAKRYGD